MGIQLVIGNSATGALLRDALVNLGVSLGGRADAVVNYGQRTFPQGLPGLNVAPYPGTKLAELQVLRDGGVSTPLIFLPRETTRENQYPLLGRKISHTQGRDIVPILSAQEHGWAVASGNVDYFTQYHSPVREFRSWVFRNSILASYEKFLHAPQNFRFVGCNHRNGFAFRRVRPTPPGVKAAALQAIRVLGLDFGAVDILESTGGMVYVLEVNRQPGVSDINRSSLQGLATRIKSWQDAGYPAWNRREARANS